MQRNGEEIKVRSLRTPFPYVTAEYRVDGWFEQQTDTDLGSSVPDCVNPAEID